jgi:autotransporter-associated beta strand protein
MTSLLHSRAARVALAVMMACAAAPRLADAATYSWKNDANGNWNVAANWTVVTGPPGLGYPSLSGDVAIVAEILSDERTITIPNGVTIIVGSLQITEGSTVTIQPVGTGRLVFQTPSGNASLVAGGGGSHRIDAPIRLDDHLDIVVPGAGASITFGNAISQALVTPWNIMMSGGGVVRFNSGVANTFGGFFAIESGELRLANTGGATAISNHLVIGDDDGAAESARVRISTNNNLADTVDISVFSDGLLAMSNFGEAIDSLIIVNGLVDLGFSAVGTLAVNDLTMQGGTVKTGSAISSQISFTSASIFLSSSATEAATLTGGGALALGNVNRTLAVVNGPLPIDAQIDVQIIGVGSASLTKSGPGTALFTNNNSYAGNTLISGGRLYVNGTQPTSPVSVVGTDAVLGGTGIVGLIGVGTGIVAPGIGGPGTLRSGSLIIGIDQVLVVELNGTTVGTGYDQVDVTGSVLIGSAVLTVALNFTPPPGAEFLIVKNDGTDNIGAGFKDLPEGASFMMGATELTITYAGGDGNDIVLRNTTPVSYFLAEGATGGFFDDDVLIANPTAADAPVTMTFLLEGGSTIVESRTVPARSRVTVHADTVPGLEAAAPSVQVTSNDGRPLIVERSMFWDPSYYGGHTANAVTRPQLSWMFAEGSQGFFDTYVLVANANASPVSVTATFLREQDTPIVRTYSMGPFSRLTVYAGDVAEVVGRSFGMVVDATLPVIAERAMYFASTPGRFWGGGHVNIGIAEPSTSWFHAEGATGGFFTTFILLSNPQSVAANVELRFLLDTGEVITRNKTIGARERLTINPAAENDPRLENAAVSTVVLSDVPIVSERSMYWPGDASPFGEGHNSTGVAATHTKWGLAEGRVGGPRDYVTYILLANPGASAANVTVTYLREAGGPVVKTYTVPPTSRFNVDVRAVVPELQNESFGATIEVTNGVPIAVERSLYWNANGIFWAGGTNALAVPVP